MTEAIKLKTGVSFLFEGQKYRGGAVRNHTIPADVVARIAKKNEATEKTNGKKKKGDDGWTKLIDLEKIKAVDKKEEHIDEEKETVDKPVKDASTKP